MVGCIGTENNIKRPLNESFAATPNTENLNMTISSVKDFVFALPAHSYHESTIEYAHDLITKEKITFRSFRGSSLESVDFIGDGCFGRSSFFLNRSAGILWQYYHAWEPGSVDSVTRYRLVPGGWMVHNEEANENDKESHR